MVTVRDDWKTVAERVNNKVTSSVEVFNKALQEYAETVPASALVDLQRKIALSLITKVVLRTPVDTGRARGNWQISLDEPTQQAIERLDKGGGAVIREAQGVLAQMGFGQVIWLSNNLDYIIVLEDGHSGQAPLGMIAVSIQEIAAEFGR